MLVTLFVDVRIFFFGFEAWGLVLQFEGERTTNDRIEGLAVTLQQFPGPELPDLLIESGGTTKDACE